MSIEKHKSAWRRIVRVILSIIGIIGIVGFLSGFLGTVVATLSDHEILTSVRFPLSLVDGACIDGDGNIYCISDFYKRIQVYDSEGCFLYGWFVPFDRVDPGISINGKSQIVAYNVSCEKRFTYTHEGKILDQSDMSKNDKQMISKGYQAPFLTSLDGNYYSLIGNIVYRIAPATGVKSVVLADPWYLTWTKGPFPAWLWVFIAISGFYILDRNYKNN